MLTLKFTSFGGNEPLVQWLFLLLLTLESGFVRGQSCNDGDYDIRVDDIDTVKVLISNVEDVLKNDTMKKCTSNFIEPMVGWPDDPNDEETDSPYSRFTQAYHIIGIPAVFYWKEVLQTYKITRNLLVNIREFEEDYDKFYNYMIDCKDIVKHAEDYNNGPNSTKEEKCAMIRDRVRGCLASDTAEKIVTETGPNDKFMERLVIACAGSIELVLLTWLNAVAPRNYNGRRATWDYSPFGIMWQDTVEYDLGVKERIENTFPEYIQRLRDDGFIPQANFSQMKLDDIKARLANSSLPYPDIYFNGNVNAMESLRNATGLASFTKLSYVLYNSTLGGKLPHGSYQEYYQKRWSRESGANYVNNFITDLNGGVVDILAGYIRAVYARFIKIEPATKPEYNPEGVLVGDGMWDWNPKIGLHNMRLAWDLMGAVLEELKCYMKETYYFDLRQKAIRATQRNLTHMFNGFSPTMLTPCRIDNNKEDDLVTKYCTAENHEICAPIAPFHPQQRPESQFHGGLGLLKPRWIFRFDEKKKECVGRRDYVVMHYVCRCGFRLDCGDDLGENITCQLKNNDRLRGQCRGSVAYPCKTLPLAPKKHDQSCVSGYCNIGKNSCEDRPITYILDKSGSSSTLKASSKVKSIVVICLGMILFVQIFRENISY